MLFLGYFTFDYTAIKYSLPSSVLFNFLLMREQNMEANLPPDKCSTQLPNFSPDSRSSTWCQKGCQHALYTQLQLRHTHLSQDRELSWTWCSQLRIKEKNPRKGEVKHIHFIWKGKVKSVWILTSRSHARSMFHILWSSDQWSMR